MYYPLLTATCCVCTAFVGARRRPAGAVRARGYTLFRVCGGNTVAEGAHAARAGERGCFCGVDVRADSCAGFARAGGGRLCRGGRAERGCVLAALLVAPATQTSLFEHTRAAAPSSATPPPSERAHDARPRSQLQLPPRSTRCCPLLSHPFQQLAQSGATWCVATSHASACAVGLARTPTRACPAAAVAVSAIATSSCQSAAPPASTAGVHKCTVGARARGWTVRGGPAFRAASSGCGALVSASAGRKRQTYQSTLRTFLRSLLPSRMR